MSPHALSTSPHISACSDTQCGIIDYRVDGHANGINDHLTDPYLFRSHLEHTSEDELHDLVCIGFGPASLAIAVALHDMLDVSPTGLARLNGRMPKVAFLERQPQFAWHAGMLLPGAKMQITFLKDMATLRNPKSEFTFLNYLHRNNRLVDFTNLNTFLPQRLEYEDYMRWCAKRFEDVVHYSQDVLGVVPAEPCRNGKTVNQFVVVSRDLATGKTTKRRAKHVVIAIGGRPNVPKPFPLKHPKIVHSSQYAYVVQNILPHRDYPYRIAVVGGGQSGAEIFSDIHSTYPNCASMLLIRGSALRPSDDSPFVNEIFNPSRVDDIFHQNPEIRASSLTEDRNTNYGVVRLELIERIYERLYVQRIQHSTEDTWPHRILPRRTVTRVEDSPSLEGGVRLYVQNDSGTYCAHEESGQEVMDVDVVFIASGYKRDVHEDLLRGLRGLMQGGDKEGNKWTVQRNYRVNFEEGLVDSDAGVWLQGCCESTHGLSDTLLSILAPRAGEILNSMFGGR